MLPVIVEIVILLLVLPFLAVGCGHLFDRADRWLMNVRARRTALRSRMAPGPQALSRPGHPGPEHLHGRRYR